MLTDLVKNLEDLLTDCLSGQVAGAASLPEISLEMPADKRHGDYSCNIALKSAKILKKSPVQIAQEFVPVIEEALEKSPLRTSVNKVEVKAPGFINFFLSPGAILTVLQQVHQQQDQYGRSSMGDSERVLIEFVSANPTGPLSLAHARQAAVGDALGNILTFIGFDVTKEYYINDGGNQIHLLGESIRCRAIELLGGEAPVPENGYEGEYVIEMARIFMDGKKIKDIDSLEQIPTDEWKAFGTEYLLDVIRKELHDFRVDFDQWTYESKVANRDAVEDVLADLKGKGFIYDKEGAQWFRSTDLGDDKDRVVRKSDGSFTYLSPDIAYHKNKYERTFKQLINIWGPDHHGYIPRLTAAIQALGHDAQSLKVLIVQLASIYKDGKALSMSTRKGQYISLKEIMEEVGVDAARYFFLMRHIKAHLDFDLELAKKQSPENPVYYIQYAHARVHSINRKAQEEGITAKLDHFEHLKEEEEMDIVKKMGQFPDILGSCSQQMDPYALGSYLHELALIFHKYYDKHRVVDENLEQSKERLALINAVRIVLANGLKLLGISAPEKM